MDDERHLREIGEAGILARLFARLGAAGEGVVVGPGDDAAVLAGAGGDAVVFASDAMAEGVHFDLAFMTAADVGWRLTCANLSDLAAMGAEPWAAVVSLAAPRSTPAGSVEAFYDGASRLARSEGLALVGGDVVASPAGLFFAMAILGRAPSGRYLSRAGASPGDVVFVSGELALAQAGLHILAGEGECRPAVAPEATRRYRRPVPRTELGRRLRAGGLASAAIDTSDSLSESLAYLASASGVGFRLEAEALPIAEAARDVASSRGEEAVAYALAAGEDFELLFTCPESKAEEALREAARAGVPARAIGVVTLAAHGLRLAVDGDEKPLRAEG
ncbi:MAG: thiamine-phosphate kinase, partial [Candidatus Coatesbacteria bacterium]